MEKIINKGLYDSRLEKDACGIGLLANIDNMSSHNTIEDALTMLENMEHRGACGCEENTGDGAGILVQLPHEFFRSELNKKGIKLSKRGLYGVGFLFLTKDIDAHVIIYELMANRLEQLYLRLLGLRNVTVNNSELGESALATEPLMQQLFIVPNVEMDQDELERKLFLFRKSITHVVHTAFGHRDIEFYLASCSSRTIVYKGQLKATQLRAYFLDLQQKEFTSAIALVHSRFSTNTEPNWDLAQPFRMIAHNGEINTIRGNRNWWHSREKFMEPSKFTADEFESLKPIVGPSGSDSNSFDNVLEFLRFEGRSVAETIMMMIPEAWENDPYMQADKKAYYEYNKMLLEPWDGPASICFTDGILVGATLDRNGLRPSRYYITTDRRLILSSEVGVLPVDNELIQYKGRLKPGRILIVDLEQKRILEDKEVKNIIANKNPYKEWLQELKNDLKDLKPTKENDKSLKGQKLLSTQIIFGYTKEEIDKFIKPIIDLVKDPIGSMGSDVPLAVLSHQPQHISNYFRQDFAQVTNPPIDPIREKRMMSLFNSIGGNFQLISGQKPALPFIHLDHPVLDSERYLKITTSEEFKYHTSKIDITYGPLDPESDLELALNRICEESEHLANQGKRILILSDRHVGRQSAPIPALMAVGAIHHHLIDKGLRYGCSLVIETGSARTVHHFVTLLGYGANAIFPFLVFNTLKGMYKSNIFSANYSLLSIYDKYVKAICKGILKVMSKMGVSTLRSYHGGQLFEILGLNDNVVDQCFKGTISKISGIGYNEISRDIHRLHNQVSSPKMDDPIGLNEGGIMQWKKKGEYHLFTPNAIHLLQQSTWNNNYDLYKKYTEEINNQSAKKITLRSLLEFKTARSISIDEVEPIENIMKRFATGAMSFGSISHEAHSTLAIAMNRIGAKSNSGEGGEDASRFAIKPNGDWERSAIKQVASGRFGVTSHYLVNAEELQIKIAQGAKPGEGGQLPGHKVNDWIARVRNSTPGVGLISPPPHHDIYSIEDLAQLIFDLKNANEDARINVKLVSKSGVGIIASGVAKGHADAILIAGHDGGTGASPLTSIYHAGLPWELGLAETHQTLVKNRLRNRVVLQCDGQLRTGRDLAIAALLGAEEWGISTAALVVEGCILMRKCHLNTCPVGIATQDEDLRKKFKGKVDHVINFFKFLAQDLREHMAMLGFKSINEMVGHADRLKSVENPTYWKHHKIDLSQLLFREANTIQTIHYKNIDQQHELNEVLDRKLIKEALPALEKGLNIKGQHKIRNTDRAVGAMLSSKISLTKGAAGLPDNTIQFTFNGSSGQSFGAFLTHGVHFNLEGEANDYVGKGLSGGILVVRPPLNSPYIESKNMIIGNVALYGATSGKAFISGKAGERFAVRNSGAKAVVESVGDHACEYMTGGIVVVLGSLGKNFGAGMSGGISYIYGDRIHISNFINQETVFIESPVEDDLEELKYFLMEFVQLTNNVTTIAILNEWEKHKYSFTKIMPKEFKVALEKMRNKKIGLQKSA